MQKLKYTKLRNSSIKKININININIFIIKTIFEI
jgi:hypothetical protein